MDIKDYIYYISDFPTKGITFNDITPLLQNAQAFLHVTEELAKFAESVSAIKIVGPESRGFIFGCPVANRLKIGFVPVRKVGKLPREVISEHYQLEYGTNTLTMHKDAISKGERCVIVDDLLATGGTIKATIKLIERLGGIVAGIATLIELTELNGREMFAEYDILTLIKN